MTEKIFEFISSVFPDLRTLLFTCQGARSISAGSFISGRLDLPKLECLSLNTPSAEELVAPEQVALWNVPSLRHLGLLSHPNQPDTLLGIYITRHH